MSKKRKNRHLQTYKDPTSSESDIIQDITDLSHISSQTSKWTKYDCLALKIFYSNAENISEIIIPITLDDHYKELELPGWNKHEFYSVLDADFQINKPRKIITIMRKITSVLLNEQAQLIRENKVDSFVMSLMDYLGFDEDPLLMHPQYDYTAMIGDNYKISSKVEYMITRRNTYIVLIVEDKHQKGVSELTDWSEPQIAGEIFGSAYHNVSIAEGVLKYPFNLYAIRVISTKFTFYKAIVTRKYLEECVNRLPIQNSLTIKRYPQQLPALNQPRILNAWDFSIEHDRLQILEVLKGLRDSNVCYF